MKTALFIDGQEIISIEEDAEDVDMATVKSFRGSIMDNAFSDYVMIFEVNKNEIFNFLLDLEDVLSIYKNTSQCDIFKISTSFPGKYAYVIAYADGYELNDIRRRLSLYSPWMCGLSIANKYAKYGCAIFGVKKF